MPELTADLFISFDGYAAGDFGPYFGYDGPELDAWVAAQAGPTMLLGRHTFEALGDALKGHFAVVSTTLDVPGVEVLRGPDEVAALKAERDLRTVGSLTLVRSLLRHGLVDRLRFVVFPLIAGPDGHEHAYTDLPRADLELGGTTILDGRLVLLDFSVR